MAGFLNVRVSGADDYHWALFNTIVTTPDALANPIGTGLVNVFTVDR
jgi:hypothetical protein